MKCFELAKLIDAKIIGNENPDIVMISPLNDPKEKHIAYAENKKALERLIHSNISAIIVPDHLELALDIKKTFLIVKNGKLAFIKCLQLFEEEYQIQNRIHSTAIIHPSVEIAANIDIMSYVVIEEGSIIEENVVLYPFTYIGKNCHIKKNTLIHSHSAIHHNSVIGENNIIHSGAVIGADGFGYHDEKTIRYKIPQLGSVETESHVEIGANSTIDRATLGKTLIGAGTKIDNLVQIAHNCTIGKNCFITSQAGIAGSSKLGDRVTLAGQAGISDHIEIGDDVIVLAQSCVTKNIDSGKVVLGFPAKDAKSYKKELAYLSRLTKKNKK